MEKLHEPLLDSFVTAVKNHCSYVEDVYLFGSRARGEGAPDSDYDLLVIVDAKSRARKEELYGIADDFWLKKGRDFSLKIFARKEFEFLSSLPTPFMKNIQKEAIKIA